MVWFLYDNGLRNERVKREKNVASMKELNMLKEAVSVEDKIDHTFVLTLCFDHERTDA